MVISPRHGSTSVRCDRTDASSLVVPAEVAGEAQPESRFYWKIVATNQHGQAESIAPYKRL